MKTASRSISWIHLVAAAVCFGFLSTALADTLTSTEIQATNSPDTELRPSLGDDLGNGIASLVVYSAFDATNKATVEYQRITDNGPVPGGHLVVSVLSNTGQRVTDDELNDVSGDLIVYTAFRADGAAQIRSY